MLRLAISGWYGNNNIGDEAILMGMLQSLRGEAPEADFLVFSDDPAHTECNHKVKAFPQLPMGMKRSFSLITHLTFWKFLWRLIKVIKGSDIFLLGGGGLLQHDNAGIILFWLSKAFLARIMGKRVVAYAIGAGPIRRRSSKIFVRLIGSKMDLITVRDEDSRRALLHCGLKNSSIYVTADPAFALCLDSVWIERMKEFLKESGFDLAIEPSIGFVLLPLWSVHKMGRKVSLEEQSKYNRLIAQAIDSIITKLNAQVLLIADNYREDPPIIIETHRLIKEKKSALIIQKHLTPYEFMGIISQMDVLVSMRLHPLCLATLTHTPVVGIIGHPKVASFLQMIKQEKYGLLLENLTSDQICKTVKQSLMEDNKIRKQLKDQAKFLREKAKLNAKLTIDLVNKVSLHPAKSQGK